MTELMEKKDKEAYVNAYHAYATVTSSMAAAALAQLAIAAIFAGIQIGAAEKERSDKDAAI